MFHLNFLLSTAYFGPIQYFSKIINGHTVIEKHENYTKQSFRNRCTILAANGPLSLNIPVKRKHGEKTLITDVRLDYDTNWTQLHRRGIMSAYQSAPFYEYYIDELIPFFERKYEFLIDYNTLITETVCELMQINYVTEFTNEYQRNEEKYIDFRNGIHPKPQKKQDDQYYMNIPYNQVFSEKFGFIENLSVLDLLFNEGPNALTVLKQSGIPV